MPRPDPAQRFVLLPVGSSGDVHPFIGVGRALRDRGHDVLVLTSAPFQEVIERAGLEFRATHTREEFEEVLRNADLWNSVRGLRLVLEAAASVVRADYEHILDVYEPGGTVIVGHGLAFAARVFEETHRVPAATLHLAPSIFRSEHAQPAHRPGGDLSSAPRWLKRAAWRLVDRYLIDPHVLPVLNEWRRELRLPPVQRVFDKWIHSPQRIIGMFPSWFGPPQPDWPRQLRLVGFPLYDEADQHTLPAETVQFLESGPHPVVFTPGSANRLAARFFDAAVDATDRLGGRALLLTPYPEQIPSPLPPAVHHASYLPLSMVLPRCAAIVHHGGIGTCAQGLLAGVPQLTMPMGFDQPDNATRLQRLGVGRWLLPRQFTGRRVAATLRELLMDGEVRQACGRWSAEVRHGRAIEEAADLLEALIMGRSG